MKIILAVNAGSSSVKLTAFAANDQIKRIAHCSVSGIESDSAELKYTRAQDESSNSHKARDAGKSHEAAFELMVESLMKDSKLSEVQSEKDISTICHRIVHGGDFEQFQTITDDVLKRLEELSDLAPLHNGSAMKIVKRCLNMSQTTNLAFFDTQFHQGIPKHVFTYPIDQEVAKKYNLRKYGFHGLSYANITRQVAQHLKKDEENINIIALHLGSGASACAIQNGKSRDTSMGLTPLSGLPGATRSGSVDPSLIFHYTSSASKPANHSSNQLHISAAEEILNKEAGWNALAGTKDFGEISQSDKDTHKLAFNMFVDRICGYVGHYYVSLRGQVDALVFAGGIGENSPQLRAAVVKDLECLGFSIDEGVNKSELKEAITDVSGKDKHRVLVCQVDEELEMARSV